MNKAILENKIQDFIQENLNSDITKLLLKGSPFDGIDIKELTAQIESKKKCQKKLPLWYITKNLYYPPKISIEQTSSELTAEYKSQLANGNTLADLTGGFGVDSYYFSKKTTTVSHFEIDPHLSEIATHNFKQLHANIKCYTEDGIKAIENKKFDVIYIDPSRRNNIKGKVFYLNDCEPNVVEHLNYLLNRCSTLLIKTSPMLDISIGLKELESVHEVHIVAVENEVKELIWILKKPPVIDLIIKTVNIQKKLTEKFDFLFGNEDQATFSEPKKYLYEPNAAIMKSGAFNSVSNYFKVDKLAVNTHLYTSDHLIEFPGRVFTIEGTIPYSKSEIKKHIAKSTANITTRNFPESVEVLRKKWKINDGGNNYLFFTTINNEKKVILECRKILK